MKGYQKILVPLDGSKLSESILTEVERLAGALDSHVLILTVHPWDPGLKQDSPQFEKEMGQRLEYLRTIQTQLANKGLNVETQVVRGTDTGKTIIDHAVEADSDLIMMSTHGYTGAKHLLFGSVAEAVVRNVKIPVFLVRP